MTDLQEYWNNAHWEWADKDMNALGIIRDRIAEVGGRTSLINYSDLVKDLPFRYPNLVGGEIFYIHPYDWSGIHRRIIGNILGYLSIESMLEHGFFSCCLVVARLESQPSDIFFKWMENLEVIPDMKQDTVLRFWADEVRKAHRYYRKQRKARV